MGITPEQPNAREAREARQEVMKGIDSISKDLLAKAAAQKDDRIPPLIDKLYAALGRKSDVYFLEKLYPTNSTMDAGAFQKIWKEIAATLR